MNGPPRAPSSRQGAPQRSDAPEVHRDAERGSRRRTDVRDLTQWLITAAACIALICATGWPIPTLITTGALAVPAFIAVEIRAHRRTKHDQEQQ